MNTISNLGVTDTEKIALEEIIKDLKRVWPEAAFKLFGSKVKGSNDPESDLDLLIEMPCTVTEAIRREIIHKVFETNLTHGSNISVFIVSKQEWENGLLSVLPIHASIEKEGIPL